MRQPRGQNFLVEKNIARKIVAAADISPADKILEIGPGKGVLTALIAPLAGEFRAVEVDRQLFESLNTSGRFPNTKFVLADFLEYPFASDLGPLKIVANLPYNVSTAIIEKFLPENNWTIAVVMVQKEVGERLTASPGTKEYGSLTIFCRHYAGIVKLFSVGPGCFFPKPKVDSVVLKLVNHFSPRLSQEFTRFVRAAFSQRRKTALNAISSSLDIPKSAASRAFEQCGICPNLRPENMNIDQFFRLYHELPFSANK